MSMGTRSRVVLKSIAKKPITLWIHFDGYLEGVGDSLCREMRKLLEKYTLEQLEVMAFNIIPQPLEDDVSGFVVDNLVPMFEGTYVPFQDECEDYAFEYVIDMVRGHVGTRLDYGDSNIFLVIKFDDIKNGMLLSELYKRHIYELE